MLNVNSTNVKIYLPIGLPDGTDDLNYNTGIPLTPKFLSVSPQTGSPAGSLITAVVKGIGIKTQNVTLQLSNGTDICASVNITNYGILQCITKALTLADQALQVKVLDQVYDCVGTNGECNY